MNPTATTHVSSNARKPLIVGLVVAVTIGLIVWIALAASTGGEPRLNESTEVLLRYLATSAFDALPFEKQRQYYKVFDDREKQVDQAFHDRRMTEAQYRAALEAAWLGKHINRVEKYISIPAGQRAAYIDGLLDKKHKKPGKEDKDKIDADESAAEARVEHWPPAVRDQWNQFHAAYKKQKQSRESAATRPQ
jgi:hypothetical protein